MLPEDVSEPLAMFPLGTTLLPRSAAPLQVFEPRYRQLVVDCLASDRSPPAFGTVLIERGSEVGGDDDRAAVGVLAEMHRITALDDGQYRLMALGTERLRVVEWLPDDPYPRARIEPWPDTDIDDPPGDDALAAVTARVEAVVQLASDAGLPVRTGPFAIEGPPGERLYRLGAAAPIGPADRYRLLAAPGAAERAERLLSALDDVEGSLRFRLDPPQT